MKIRLFVIVAVALSGFCVTTRDAEAWGRRCRPSPYRCYLPCYAPSYFSGHCELPCRTDTLQVRCCYWWNPEVEAWELVACKGMAGMAGSMPKAGIYKIVIQPGEECDQKPAQAPSTDQKTAYDKLDYGTSARIKYYWNNGWKDLDAGDPMENTARTYARK